MTTPIDYGRIRCRILEELPEAGKSSPAKPFVNYRYLPVATQYSAELILAQLEILQSEGRVELKRLADQCAVKLTPLGLKSLEMVEDEWHRRTSASPVNTAQQAIRNPQPGDGDQTASAKPHHPRAFVSHSSQDHDFVINLATDLRANGVDAWYDEWEIKPGDSIRAKIDEGLADCEFFIIVLSRSSIARPWVQTELDGATIRKLNGKVRKIIPVKIEDCGDLPATLASLLWEDFSNKSYEAALRRILDSIFDVDIRPPLGRASQSGGYVPKVKNAEAAPKYKAEEGNNRSTLVLFFLGVAASLLPAGLQFIGITVNLWVGSAMILTALVLAALAFWWASGSSRWRNALRSVIVVVMAICLNWTGNQVIAVYRTRKPPSDDPRIEAGFALGAESVHDGNTECGHLPLICYDEGEVQAKVFVFNRRQWRRIIFRFRNLSSKILDGSHVHVEASHTGVYLYEGDRRDVSRPAHYLIDFEGGNVLPFAITQSYSAIPVDVVVQPEVIRFDLEFKIFGSNMKAHVISTHFTVQD